MNRPRFFAFLVVLFLLSRASFVAAQPESPFFEHFRNAPTSFTLMPFWFWNDELKHDEIVRQIADFEAHGVYGFVIHPRIGLPEDTGWMSPKLLAAMRVALEEAKKRGMYVLLYDEGMYPSGSSAGQVAEKNPRFAARGFAMQELADDVQDADVPQHPEPLWDLITVLKRPNGKRIAVYERPTDGWIRGLHYLKEGTPEQRDFHPKAGDILSADAAACFRELVYDRYFQEFHEYFGSPVIGIFTDEPCYLGRGFPKGMVPGNAQALKKVSERLGYDFTPYLADLWFSDTPESEVRRLAYHRAIHHVLIEVYYKPLSEWCAQHGVALCGHPDSSADLVSEATFQIPGQDLVWSMVKPGAKALNGPDSTVSKVASSAMTHFGRTRNLNELYGAYGHDMPFEEIRWLANWTLVRGQNLLVPHAFYYSIRGPRFHECPPAVGPNAPWWNDGFREYADACRRISWLNTGKPVIHAALLTDGVNVPSSPAKPLFENQLDFNYLMMEQMLEEGTVDADGLHLAGMTYQALVLPRPTDEVPNGFYESEIVKTLEKQGRLVKWTAEDVPAYVAKIRALICENPGSDVVRLSGTNAAGIRIRHERLEGVDCVLLFNETETPAEITLANLPPGPRWWLNAETGEAIPCESVEKVPFAKFEMKILAVGK